MESRRKKEKDVAAAWNRVKRVVLQTAIEVYGVTLVGTLKKNAGTGWNNENKRLWRRKKCV